MNQVDALSQFANNRYIVFETFKRNGEGIKTPVWFVEQGGKLYVWTITSSGKARRIRNNPQVRIAPSTARGHAKADWLAGTAHVLAEKLPQIIDLFQKKYGIQFWLLSHLHGRGRIIIEVALTT